jgi:glycosyltransferase involved in cell wall biosynthesis
MMTDNYKMRAVGQWKRNDLLLLGFADFLKRVDKNKVVLTLIDRPDSPDVNGAKKLISEMNIQDNVIWLKPLGKEGFARHEMLKYYEKSDVVADDFGIGWGWYGSVVMESLAMRKPLLANVNTNTLPSYYSWHPVISVNTVEGLSNELEKLYHDTSYRKYVGERGRQWIEEYHSPKIVSAEFVRYINQLMHNIK